MLNNKQIAKELDRYVSLFAESCPDNSENMTINIDGLTIRLKPSQKAIRSMAAKFRRNWPGNNGNVFNTVTTLSPRNLFKQFCADGETENAINLAMLKGIPVIFSAGKKDNPNILLCTSFPIRNHADFVVGRIYASDGKLQPWEVYHVLSGMGCSSSGTSKEASVLKFNSIPADKLESAVKSAADRTGFQQQAISEYVKND